MGIGVRAGIGVLLACSYAATGFAATRSSRFEVRATVLSSCALNPSMVPWTGRGPMPICLPAPTLSSIPAAQPVVRLLRGNGDGISQLVVEF